MEQFMEAPGTPPAFVFDAPQHGGGFDSPVITARFYLGPDPRPDPVGQTLINENGDVPIIELVEITNLNDPKCSPSIQIATDHHRYKARRLGGFAAEYRQFKEGLEMESGGTPLRNWIGENDRTKNLANFSVHTVEQLAQLSDSLCQTLGPGTYDLVRKAKAYLETHKDSGAATQALVENAKLKDEMAELKAMVARLAAVDASRQARAPDQYPEMHPAELLPAQPEKRQPGRPRANQGA